MDLSNVEKASNWRQKRSLLKVDPGEEITRKKTNFDLLQLCCSKKKKKTVPTTFANRKKILSKLIP